MRYVRWHDLGGFVIALVLLLGILACVFAEREVPDYLSHGFTASVTWIFRSGIHIANDFTHRQRGGPND